MTSGRIAQLNVSAGGVPKRPVAYADVDGNGLVGDKVARPRFHGGPDRAVCLYSLERILALQSEGSPVFPGALGENVTLTGLAWEQVTPGARIVSGDVELEITKYATPCATTSIYTNGDLRCYAQESRPGWSRVYARVLRHGRLVAGAPVQLERKVVTT